MLQKEIIFFLTDREIGLIFKIDMRDLIDLIETLRTSGKDLVIGELGCFEGGTTIYLCEYLKKNTKSGLYIVIDWFKGNIDPTLRGGYAVTPGFKEKFIERTKAYDFVFFPVESSVAASIIKDETFDFFWIDADHRYHAIKKDIELWLPKVKKGGILAGHDYDSPVYKEEFIEQDFVEGSHHGVTKAVNEAFGSKVKIVSNNWYVHV